MAVAATKKGKTIFGTARADVLTGTGNDDTIYGGAGHDRLDGGKGNDVLDGGTGDDKLFGDDGNDKLIGGAGADQLSGGAGDDTLIVDLDDTLVAGGAGVDIVVLTGVDGFQDYSGKAALWTGIEKIAGTAFNDYVDVSAFAKGVTVDGGAGDDNISTGSGNDVVNGGDGADFIVTGGGNDTIFASADDLYVDAGDGYDRVFLTGTPDASGMVVFTGAFWNNVEEFTGTAFNDRLDLGGFSGGVSGALTIKGGAGDDEINGNGVADSIYGGTGNDIIHEYGNAVLIDGGAGYDRVVVLSESIGGGGFVQATGTWLSIEAVVGTEYADNITLNALTSGMLIDAGAGNDRVDGGLGRDTVLAGEGSDFLDGGAGIDTVVFSGAAADYRIFDDVSGVIVTTDLRPEGTGTLTDGQDVLTNFEIFKFADGVYNLAQLRALPVYGTDAGETLSGSELDNTIDGRGGDDWVFGNSGNDTIYGGAGADLLFGGNGDDTIYTDGVDQIIFGDAGFDRVFVTEVTGGSILIGDGQGIEEIYGNSGNDIVDGQFSHDAIVAFGGGGNDLLFSGSGADSLDGGAGDDTLWGGANSDVLTGGAGNDDLFGGTGGDRFVFAGADFGIDVINDFSAAEDKIDLTGQGLSFSDLIISDGGFYTVLEFGADMILFTNQAVANFTADQFLL